MPVAGVTPDNGSGYGRGQYAAPEQVAVYLERMSDYLLQRNMAWLDWNTDEHSNLTEGVRELCNVWQADDYLVGAAIRAGWLDPASMPDGGIKNRQIGLYSAVVYFRGEEGRRFIAFELKRLLDRLEVEQETELARKEG